MLIPRFLLYYFNFKYEKTTKKFFLLFSKRLFDLAIGKFSRNFIYSRQRKKYFIRQIIAIMQNRQNQNRNYVQTLLIVSLFFV
jgi:hypothetical protein